MHAQTDETAEREDEDEAKGAGATEEIRWILFFFSKIGVTGGIRR